MFQSAGFSIDDVLFSKDMIAADRKAASVYTEAADYTYQDD